MIGSRIGPYEVTGKIGEGGMGEVYRAADARLRREVAIKVLPPAFTADAERLERFEREAQLLAQLHHPNIASVFGLEESAGVLALVMELVEGPTLAERLESGALPLADALPLARQLAEALEAAHERGIVHRDLKPANVKVRPDGAVKVLDFGLAKAMDSAGSPASGADLARSPTLMHSPTLTRAGTQAGIILGTAAYMSPEQARGGVVDKRADIWAFGVVLYEMLVGRSLFAGPTVSDTLAEVLKTEVDWAALPAATPPAIRRLLRRCLERNPKNRLHDVADARIVLEEVLAGRDAEPAAAPPAATPAAPRRRARSLALAAALLALGLVAGWLLHRPPAAGTAAASRWALGLPDGASLSTADFPQLAISRDGRFQVAVVVDASGTSQLLLRRSDEFEPHLLAGTEGALGPFFSPDGAWIGFSRDDALMKVPVAGGPAIRLAPVLSGGRGATWSDDGFIYFATDFGSPLVRVAASGGAVQPVTRLDTARSERTHRWPEALPGGEAILFTCDTQGSTEYYDDARIEAVRPATGERRVLVEGASQARYAPGGHLVFARGGSLYSVRFDARALAVRGEPVEVVGGVATNVGSGAVQFALAESGAAIWAPGGLSAAYRVVWVDRKGDETPVAVPPAPYQELALSPDGRKLALVGGQGGISDLWVADLERGGVTRLTSGKFVRSPVWTPDGSRVAFGVLGPGELEDKGRMAWIAADGSRDAEYLVGDEKGYDPSSFSPDGRALIFDDPATFASGHVWSLALAGERIVRPLVAGPFHSRRGIISPDSRWIAYVSNESGQDNVYVRPYPQGEGKWQVSFPLGVEPRWSGDGRELYYRANSALYRSAVDTSHGFAAGRPVPVLDRVASGNSVQSYAIAPDGSRLLTFRTGAGSGAQHTLYLDLAFARRLDAGAGER